jgi:hypothetical protein
MLYDERRLFLNGRAKSFECISISDTECFSCPFIHKWFPAMVSQEAFLWRQQQPLIGQPSLCLNPQRALADCPPAKYSGTRMPPPPPPPPTTLPPSPPWMTDAPLSDVPRGQKVVDARCHFYPAVLRRAPDARDVPNRVVKGQCLLSIRDCDDHCLAKVESVLRAGLPKNHM